VKARQQRLLRCGKSYRRCGDKGRQPESCADISIRSAETGAACPGSVPGYSMTIRDETSPSVRATSDLAAAVAHAGGSLTALDVAESHPDRLVGVRTKLDRRTDQGFGRRVPTGNLRARPCASRAVRGISPRASPRSPAGMTPSVSASSWPVPLPRRRSCSGKCRSGFSNRRGTDCNHAPSTSGR
jgi:hypothetical protein